jgi:hypothetical protein
MAGLYGLAMGGLLATAEHLAKEDRGAVSDDYAPVHDRT